MSQESRYKEAMESILYFGGTPRKPTPRTALAYYFHCRSKGYRPFDAFLATEGIFSKTKAEKKIRYLRMCRALGHTPQMYLEEV